MSTKNVIKTWKNAEFSAENSPIGASQINTSVLAQVQGGRNNVIVTGCIPDPFPFPKYPKGGGGGTTSCPYPSGDDILVLA